MTMKKVAGDQKYGKAALIVAVLALVVAVGGGAYAAKVKLKKNQVTTKVIKNKAVTTKKLAGAAVTSAKLGDASVTATKLGTITTRSKTLGPVAAGTAAADTVVCNSDEVPISGGGAYQVSVANADVQIRSSFKDTANNGWRVAVVNEAAAPHSWTIDAYCLKK
jgi:hypothetical protein